MSLFHANRELLEAFRRGDTPALTEAFNHYVEDVARVIRLGFRDAKAGFSVPGVRSAAREEELVQEVFLRAFAPSARSAYDGLSPYAPYVLRIAKNLLIDEARARNRMVLLEPAQLADLVENSVTDPALSLEEELALAPLREATKAFRAGLDEATSEFIRLRFEEGKSQAEVGSALNLTRRRIRTLEDQIRRQLADFLEARNLSLT